jgi:hypothetical protein
MMAAQRLTSTQRRVLTWLADGATTKHDIGEDGWLERLILMFEDGSRARCSHSTWASLLRRGLVTWTHPNQSPYSLRITDDGRAALS